MSGGPVCSCGAKSAWVVFDDHCNHSAFNAYRCTSSDYSGVMCTKCGVHWRTKAKYVDGLRRVRDFAEAYDEWRKQSL